MTNEIRTREEWLFALALAMKPEIEERAGLTLPPFRVTCGFPSKGGMMGGRTRVRGQCWRAEASDDGHAEIFISPVEDEIGTVAPILAHEMVHAALPDAGHNRTFQAAVRALGHDSPYTTAVATPAFWAWAQLLIDALPPYPHRKLNAMKPVAAKKKQPTRYLKCWCPECGYTVRTTRKWLDEAGPPHCPRHDAMMFDAPEEDDDTADADHYSRSRRCSVRNSPRRRGGDGAQCSVGGRAWRAAAYLSRQRRPL